MQKDMSNYFKHCYKVNSRYYCFRGELIVKYLLYLMIFASPMSATVYVLETSFGRISLFRSILLITILLTVALYASKGKRIKLYCKKNRLSIMFMTIWLLYALVSFFWAKDYSDWMRYTFFLIVGVITMLLFNNYLNDLKSIIGAFQALTWGITVQACIGWYEVISGNYLFGFAEGIYNIKMSLKIPVAMCGGSNEFATLMFLGVFTAYACYSWCQIKLVKKLYLFMLVNDLVLLIVTKSRSAMIGFLLSFILLLFIGDKRKKIFFSLLSMIVLTMPPVIEFLSANIHFNFELGSDSYRLALLKNGFLMLLNSFGIGVGAGQAEYWLKRGMVYKTGGVTVLHNWWMEILASYGIFIFAGYLLFYYKLFMSCFRDYKYSHNGKIKAIGVSICAIMFGYVIVGIGASSNMTNEWLWIFWGVCIAYQGVSNKSEKIASNL
ncbi:MAG: O-antigen ligase family protein [Lachnospiraceae bacterium]|nr:O-antigen ligase family protein [Lachnospiraceae bacterium]